MAVALLRSVCPGATRRMRTEPWTATLSSGPASGFSVIVLPLIAWMAPTTCLVALCAAGCWGRGIASARAIECPTVAAIAIAARTVNALAPSLAAFFGAYMAGSRALIDGWGEVGVARLCQCGVSPLGLTLGYRDGLMKCP